MPTTWVSNGAATGGSGSYVAGTQSVQYCHDNFVNPGDTIQIPAGTSYSWGTQVNITKQCTLSAATAGSVLITSTITSGYVLNITSSTTGAADGHNFPGHTYLTNLNFLQTGANEGGASYALNIDRSDWSGTAISSPGNLYTVIVQHCQFDSGSTNWYMVQGSANGLIFSNCTFLTSGVTLPGYTLCGITFQCTKYGNTATFNTLSTMGLQQDSVLGPSNEHLNVGDTAAGYMGVAGLNCSYVENCTINSGTEGSMNGSNSSRVVVRYCNITDASPFTHGQDSDPTGARHYEFYENTCQQANSQYDFQCYISFRGGTGVVANNSFGTIYVGKTGVIMECQQINRVPSGATCPTAWPANRGCGTSSWSPDSSAGYGSPATTEDGTGMVLEPFYIWGNTGGAGETYANYVGVDGPTNDACGNKLCPSVPFTGNFTAGGNTITNISIPGQTGPNSGGTTESLSPTLTVGMGIFDNSNSSSGFPLGGAYFANGTYIESITGSGTAPTSITVSTTALQSGTNYGLTSGFMTQGRDYVVGTARPGWVQYTYPHPLVSGYAPATAAIIQHVSSASNNKAPSIYAASGSQPSVGGQQTNAPSSNFYFNSPNPVLPSNAIAFFVSCPYVSGMTVTVTDNIGTNNYAVVQGTNNGTQMVMLAYAISAASGTQNFLLNFNVSGTAQELNNVQFDFFETQNVIGLDVHLAASVSGVSPVSSGQITTTENGDLIVNYAYDVSNILGQSTTLTSLTPGTGFTFLTANIQQGVVCQYQVQSSEGAITPSFAQVGATDAWLTMSVAFLTGALGTAPGKGIRIFNVNHVYFNRSINIIFPTTGNLIYVATAFGQVNDGIPVTFNGSTPSNTWVETDQTVPSGGATPPQTWYAANATPSTTMVIDMRASVEQSPQVFGISFVLYDILNAAASPYDSGASPAGRVGTVFTSGSNNGVNVGNFTLGTLTPTSPVGLCFCIIGTNLGFIKACTGTGQVLDAITYYDTNNSEYSCDYMDNADGYGHVYYNTTAAINFGWTLAQENSPVIAENGVIIAFRSASDAVFMSHAAGITKLAMVVSLSLAAHTASSFKPKADALIHDTMATKSSVVAPLKPALKNSIKTVGRIIEAEVVSIISDDISTQASMKAPVKALLHNTAMAHASFAARVAASLSDAFAAKASFNNASIVLLQDRFAGRAGMTSANLTSSGGLVTPSLVQHNQVDTNATGYVQTIAFNTPVLPSHLLIIVIGWFDTVAKIGTVSDNVNGNWLPAGTTTTYSNEISQAIYYLADCMAGNTTVTVNFSAQYVQGNGSGITSGTSATLAYTSNVTAGNFLIVMVKWATSGSPTVSVADTLGNSWTAMSAVAAGTGLVTQQIFYCTSASSGANTVTVNFTVSESSIGINVAEYLGVTGVADGRTHGSSASSTSLSTGSFSTANANDLIIATLVTSGALSGGASGWNVRQFDNTNFFGFVDRFVNATGSYSYTATTTAPWAAVIYGFEFSSNGATTPNLEIMEWAGVAQQEPLDAFSGQGQGAVINPTSGPVTPTASGDLCIGGFTYN